MKLKFTKRQIKIIVVTSFAVLLVLPISFAVVRNWSQKDSRLIDAPNNLDLVNARNLNISSLQTIQSKYNISDEELTNGLKALDKSFTKNDWRNYFKEEIKISELDNKLAFSSQLVVELFRKKTPNPLPNSSPTNKWETILWKIAKFIRYEATTLQDVKDFIKNYPDPLEGIDLKAEEALKRLKQSASSNSKISILQGTKWEKYVFVPAAGDGNCFLNSFSNLLTGKAGDISLNFNLRVAMCLEIISNVDVYVSSQSSDEEKLNFIKEKLINEGIALNREWLDVFHILFLLRPLKRPLVSLYVAKESWADLEFPLSYDKNKGEESEEVKFDKCLRSIFEYSEPFVIYNSGGHFQPLIKI